MAQYDHDTRSWRRGCVNRLGWFMVLSAIFNNISVISWRSVLLVEETGVHGENHWLAASQWLTLSYNVVSCSPPHWTGFELTTLVVIGTDCTGSCNSNHHAITTTAAPVSTNVL
jgi:hypothetical protein